MPVPYGSPYTSYRHCLYNSGNSSRLRFLRRCRKVKFNYIYCELACGMSLINRPFELYSLIT